MMCPLCTRSLKSCQCGTTPAAPVPANTAAPLVPSPAAPVMPVTSTAPAPKARTFVKMGAYMICQRCQFAVQYCRCGELLDAEKAPEGGPAAQSLAQRIAEVKK